MDNAWSEFVKQGTLAVILGVFAWAVWKILGWGKDTVTRIGETYALPLIRSHMTLLQKLQDEVPRQAEELARQTKHIERQVAQMDRQASILEQQTKCLDKIADSTMATMELQMQHRDALLAHTEWAKHSVQELNSSACKYPAEEKGGDKPESKKEDRGA